MTSRYDHSYGMTKIEILDWLVAIHEANGIKRPSYMTSWRKARLRSYMNKIIDTW